MPYTSVSMENTNETINLDDIDLKQLETALSELTRAFDYLSAGRRREYAARSVERSDLGDCAIGSPLAANR